MRSGEGYEVSNQGRVRNSRGRIVKPFTDKSQVYDRIELWQHGIRKKAMVHILVAEAFIGPKLKGYEVDHINTNIHDNRACNLKYVTRAENLNNPHTQINRLINRIRRAIQSGRMPQEKLQRLIAILEDFLK